MGNWIKINYDVYNMSHVRKISIDQPKGVTDSFWIVFSYGETKEAGIEEEDSDKEWIPSFSTREKAQAEIDKILTQIRTKDESF